MTRKWKIALGVLGVLAVAALVLGLNLSSIVKKGIETLGPKLTGCPVTVGSVSLSPLTGGGSVQDLVVGNPEGFSDQAALRLGAVRVKVSLRSLLTERVVVEEITVESPEILYELGLGSSNIGCIQKNLEEGSGDKKAAPEKGPGKKVQIDHILVKDGRIRLGTKLLGGKAVPIPLPDVEMRDIGKDDGGVSMAQSVSIFFGRLAAGVFDAAKKGGSLLKDALNPFK